MKNLVAEFEIPGEPTSKARARFTGYGSKHRAYTPEKTRSAEEKVLAAYLAVAAPNLDPEEAFGVEVDFFHQTGQRRDVDNMLKLVLDALNKVAFPDDVQVTHIAGVKRRVPKGEAKTVVRLFSMGQIEKPRANCLHCGTEFPTYESTANQRKFCARACGYEYRKANRTKVCANCGGDFLSRGNTFADRCCSVECNSQYKRVELECVTCGATFTKPRSVAHKGVANCSEECSRQYHREAKKVAARAICPDCGGPKSTKRAMRCQGCNLIANTRWSGKHIRKPGVDDAA